MERALKLLNGGLPLIFAFAFAFLVPLIDQIMQTAQIAVPFGLSTLTAAMVVGGGWGLIAVFTGRWV